MKNVLITETREHDLIDGWFDSEALNDGFEQVSLVVFCQETGKRVGKANLIFIHDFCFESLGALGGDVSLFAEKIENRHHLVKIRDSLKRVKINLSEPEIEDRGSACLVETLEINPEFRQQGYGQSVMLAIRSISINNFVDEIYLVATPFEIKKEARTPEDYARLNSFYLKAGYHPCFKESEEGPNLNESVLFVMEV